MTPDHSRFLPPEDGDARDLLLARVAGREDRPADWDALGELAAGDPRLWADLAAELEADALLRAGAAMAITCAATVELPPRPAAVAIRWRRAGGWLGWVVAAGIALSALASPPDSVGETGPRRASAEAGEVIGELPRQVWSTAPAAGGGIEVVYLRRMLQRTRVDGLFEVHVDDAGQPLRAPIHAAAYAPPQSF